MTFVIYDTRKPKAELFRDIVFIIILQTGGLTYGINTVFQARPVALVFEKERFRVVTYSSVEKSELMSGQEIHKLSLSGPVLLATREFRDAKEKSDAVTKGLAGVDIGMRPSFWIPYTDAALQVRVSAMSFAKFLKYYPNDEAILALPEQLKCSSEKLLFVPVIARNGDWVAVIDGDTLSPITFIPKNGFFS